MLTKKYDPDSAERINYSAYGVILKVKNREDGKFYALKTIQTRDHKQPKYELTEVDKKEVRKKLTDEIHLLEYLAANIPRSLMDCHILPMIDKGTFPTNIFQNFGKKEEPAFVMPLADKSLADLFKDCDRSGPHPFSFSNLIKWARQITNALAKFHKVKPEEGFNFAHRDIKPHNIVLMGDAAYLIDFGGNKPIKNEDGTTSFMGTVRWMAPEQLIPRASEPSKQNTEKKWRYLPGKKADIYALGLVLYWLLLKGEIPRFQREMAELGNQPFAGIREQNLDQLGGLGEADVQRLEKAVKTLIENASTGTAMVRPDYLSLPDNNEIAEKTLTLIQSMLIRDYRKRPNTEKLGAGFREIEQLLNPSIELLEIDCRKEWDVGARILARIHIRGKGLPDRSGWLKIMLAEQLPESLTREDTHTWLARFSPADQEGVFDLTARVVIHNRAVKAKSVPVTVRATAEQLWDKGDYAGALVKDPDREGWLSWIRGEVGGQQDLACQWTDRLEPVYHTFVKNNALKSHLRFSHLFFELSALCQYGPPPSPISPSDPKKQKRELLSQPMLTAKFPLWIEKNTRMIFVWLPGTERFMMGQTEAEKSYLIKEYGQDKYNSYWSDESPSHPVKVDGFWMAEAPVTRGQFRLFLKDNPNYKAKLEKDKSAWIFNKSTDWKLKKVKGAGWDSPGFDQDDTHPVVCVSHRDALAFIKWLNKETGQQFMLPTEAQWEYAARGGTQTMRFWGDDDTKACGFANVANKGEIWKYFFPCKDGYKFTSPVGPLRSSNNAIKRNGFKLYDMLGNAWEWCSDNYDKAAYRQRPLDKVTPNPVIRNHSDRFLLRGGGWFSRPGGVRAAYRDWCDGSSRRANFGFRLCCPQVRQNP